MRELPLRCTVRMWDTYLAEGSSEGFSEFHVYVCAAFLVKWSSQLRSQDFQVQGSSLFWGGVEGDEGRECLVRQARGSMGGSKGKMGCYWCRKTDRLFVLGYHALSSTTTNSKLASQGCRIAFIGSLHVENFISQCSQPPKVDQLELHHHRVAFVDSLNMWTFHTCNYYPLLFVYNTFITDIARQYHSSCSWTSRRLFRHPVSFAIYNQSSPIGLSEISGVLLCLLSLSIILCMYLASSNRWKGMKGTNLSVINSLYASISSSPNTPFYPVIDHPTNMLTFPDMFDAFVVLLMQCECYVLLATWSVSYGFACVNLKVAWKVRFMKTIGICRIYPESEEREKRRRDIKIKSAYNKEQVYDMKMKKNKE